MAPQAIPPAPELLNVTQQVPSGAAGGTPRRSDARGADAAGHSQSSTELTLRRGRRVGLSHLRGAYRRRRGLDSGPPEPGAGRISSQPVLGWIVEMKPGRAGSKPYRSAPRPRKNRCRDLQPRTDGVAELRLRPRWASIGSSAAITRGSGGRCGIRLRAPAAGAPARRTPSASPSWFRRRSGRLRTRSRTPPAPPSAR